MLDHVLEQGERHGSTIRGEWKENDRGIPSTYYVIVETPDGKEFEKPSWWSAVALAAIRKEYQGIDLKQEDEELIHVAVALDGKPAVAAYLLGVHEMSRGKVAERLGIKETSVREYLRRFRRGR